MGDEKTNRCQSFFKKRSCGLWVIPRRWAFPAFFGAEAHARFRSGSGAMQALQDGASAPPVLATVMALPVLTSPKTLPPLSFRSWSESRRIWWRVRRMQRRHVRAAAADVAITLSSRQSAGDGAATDQARAAQSAPYPALVSGSAKSLDEVERWLRRAQAEVTPTATPQRVAAPAAPPTPLAPDTVVSRTTLQNGVFIDELFGPPPAESLVVGDVTNLETAFSSVALQERARRQEEETRIAAEYGAQRGGSDFGISGEQMNFQAPDIGPGRRFAYKRAAAVAKSGGRGKRPVEETVFARVAGRYVTAAELVDECEIMLSESSDSDEAQDDGETEVEDQESDWKLEALAVLAGQEVRVRIQCGGVQLVRRAQASSRRRRCTELVASPSQRILRLDHDQIWKEWFKTPFAQQLKSCLQQLNSKKPEGTRDPLLAPAALADGGIVMVCLIPGKMFPQELRPKLPMPADDSGVVCDVCSEGPPGLLSCCECGIHVHATCYGIDLPVDDSEWTCDLCAAYQAGLLGAGQTPACTACIHCPHRGGAMKRAVGLSAVAEQEPASTWIHAFCAVRHEDYVFKYPSRYDLVPGGDWIAEMRAYVRPRIISALENAQRFDADMDELPFARFDPERSVVILSDAADRAWDATYGNGESTRAGLCAICGETPNVLQRQWHLPCLTRCAAHGCRVWFHASCGQLKGWGTGFAMKREGSAAVPVPVSFCPAHCRAADGAMQAEELVDQYDNVGGWLRNIDEKLNGAPNSMRSSYLNRALPEEVKERGRAIAAQRAREGKAKERRKESASWTSLSLDSPRDHRGSAHRKPKRPPAGGRQKRKRPRVVLQSDDEEEETPPPPAKAPPKLPTP
eukprot:scaffold8_cov249-Pinguiococcus_pyrenoidosus.AAC.29